jgi:glycosyltransferase involved in cell wall biosynthesis
VSERAGPGQPAAGPLALLGAFPFPCPQGSQAFLAEQARALAHAGAAPVLLTYGRGRGAPPVDLVQWPAPGWASPRAMRSGPQWGKPLADVALLATLLRARRHGFSAVLAHNAEAACLALAARPWLRAPVVYVAHTLLAEELSAYATPRWRGALDRTGARLDRFVASRVDGVIALCEEAREALAPFARGPIVVLPPGLEIRPAPTAEAIRRACARHALAADGFVLYAGNLDGYQDLALLAAAARRRPAAAPPIVVATHDARDATRIALGDAPLRVVEVEDFEETRALVHAARTAVLTRRRPGGFPVKLLNYMEAARPIVAYAHVAPGLRHGESAWLLARGEGPDALARALATLDADPALRARLGAGARSRLERAHDWASIARRTLAFVEAIRR